MINPNQISLGSSCIRKGSQVGQCWSHVGHMSAPGVLEEVDDPESPSGVDASCASCAWIVSEMAPEASLDHDVRAARKMLGDSAVMLTQLGTEYWRVRLLVKVQHQNLSTPLGVNQLILQLRWMWQFF